MSTQPQTQQTADTQHYRAILHDLLDLGTSLAHQVHAQAMAHAQVAPPAAAEPGPTPDAAVARTATLTAAFDRIARCVRRTILLAQHIDELPKATPGTVDRAAARRSILRSVETAIDRAAFSRRKPIDKDALQAELHERLDRPELAEILDEDIANRPIKDIIDEIVRDFGIGFAPAGVCPARRRTPNDIAALHARAAAPSGSAPPTPNPVPAEPTPPPPTQPAARHPAPIMVPIPDDPPPDLAAMLALCAQLVGDG